MTRAIDIPKLYRRPVNIWVEDALTSEYLQDVWFVPDFRFLIAGSKDAIPPVVRDARQNGLGHVFGVADRDFENTNYNRWDRAEVDVFVLPVHEIENYVIDPAALAASDVNTNTRSEGDIRDRLRRRAGELHWWMACRHTIKRLRTLCWDDFVTVPAPAQVTDAATALKHIVDAPWYRRFPGDSLLIADVDQVNRWIDESHQGYNEDLAGDLWRWTFAGKELLRDVRGFIYEPPRRAPASVLDVDVAKSVARWQRLQQRTPDDLTRLLGILRSRV